MNHKTFLLFAALLILTGCANNKAQIDYQEDIETLEKGLLPIVRIKGSDMLTYDIYDRMEFYKVPGVSIAFMDKGQIQWTKGYGFTDISQTNIIDENTLFQAASISKPVAAMAALHLVEEGKLGLDDNVNDYLIDWQVEDNEFTLSEKVTLRRILSHSAGLTVHGFAGYAVTDTVPDIIEILDGTGKANSGRIYPNIAPGTTYRYSGGGYTIMQKMLCDITGKNFPELMDELVLEPIGMESSTYRQPLPEELAHLAAIAYKSDGTEVEGQWHTYPEMAAAGLWTTPTDLLKYALEVQEAVKGNSAKVISKEMAIEMLSPQMASHGLGPALDGKNASATFSHGGANMGYRCRLTAFTNGGQGVAIMTNSDNGDVLSGEILRAFSRLYGWENYKQIIKKVVDLDDSLLKEFEGKYSLKMGDQELIFTLTKEDKHLKGFQLWDNGEFQIYPESEILFFNMTDRAPFEFERNSKGEVSGVIFREEYHFKRVGETE